MFACSNCDRHAGLNLLAGQATVLGLVKLAVLGRQVLDQVKLIDARLGAVSHLQASLYPTCQQADPCQSIEYWILQNLPYISSSAEYVPERGSVCP